MPKQVTVSERNLQNAAIRLLPKHNKLVSSEVAGVVAAVVNDKLQSFLERIAAAFPNVPEKSWRVFMTGSGAGPSCSAASSSLARRIWK